MQVQFLPGSHRLNDFFIVITVGARTWSLGTGQMSAELWLDRAAPGSYQLNKSIEPRARTCPTAGQHLHLLCILIIALADRYCCAPPEDLQGLHFSGGVSGTCMSAPGCAQECSSSKQGWASRHDANQMLLHVTPWDSPSPSSLFSSKGPPPPWDLPRWGSGGQFYHIPAACQQPGPKSLPSMLKLIWIHTSSDDGNAPSFWEGGAPLVPPLAILVFNTLLKERKCLKMRWGLQFCILL